MLNERLSLLMEAIDVNNKTLSEYARLDTTSLSRLKSGARVPKQSSKTVEKLVAGIVLYCRENGKTERLLNVVECEKSNQREGIISWMFSTSNTDFKSSYLDHEFSSFGDKLNASMLLAGLNNIKLAKLTNTDPSYISRFKNGKRTPKSNPELIELLCATLLSNIEEQNNINRLKKLMAIKEELDENSLYSAYKNWLCDFNTTNYTAVKGLLSTINSIELQSHNEIKEYPKVSFEKKTIYYDDSGLQEAVLRFLYEVIESGAKEILLYSDRDIGWMTENRDFNQKWKFLMATLVKNGIKIKIIHNIDRNIKEMTAAINSWLPLYMTGMIEPFYLSTKNGNRFSHTMFICKEVACIEGFNLRGASSSIFNYYTDGEHLSFYSNRYSDMLTNTSRLIQVKPYDRRAENDSYIFEAKNMANIKIYIGNASVTVSRINKPQISFVVLQPLLCNAIKAFCRENEQKAGDS